MGLSGEIKSGERPVVQAVGVQRHFDTPDGTLPVLQGIDFSLGAGRMAAIVGASGVGKSTFLHVLGGLDRPSGGEVYWGDRSPYEMGEEERARYRNSTVGFVFQFHHLLTEFTALENVALPLIIGGRRHAEALVAAREMLASVGLEGRVNHRPGELSGGEQQRAAVARALVTGAKVLIADEPSGNLDRRTAEQLHDLMGTIKIERGCAVVVATHNADLASRADDIYTMRDGILHRNESDASPLRELT